MMQECSFQPNLITKNGGKGTQNELNEEYGIINKNKYGSQVPIHERVGTIIKDKNQRLQQLRVKAEE